MIPNRLALLLQDDGWYVRSEIIWHKPNPMPESVLDRPTCSHEKVWLLTKSARYFYDGEAIRESGVGRDDDAHAMSGELRHPRKVGCVDKQRGHSRRHAGFNDRWDGMERSHQVANGANARNVWTIPSEPYRGAHYAVMPSSLAERCIMAGCPERLCQHCGAPHVRKTERESISLRPNSDSIRGNSPSSGRANGGNPQRGSVGVRVKSMGFEPSCSCFDVFVAGSVLDPFGGAGTTGLVADRLGRHATLIELNPMNREMAADRVTMDGPLFAEVTT